eukprot:1507451-Pyramimonas_sp.AAC.1
MASLPGTSRGAPPGRRIQIGRCPDRNAGMICMWTRSSSPGDQNSKDLAWNACFQMPRSRG